MQKKSKECRKVCTSQQQPGLPSCSSPATKQAGSEKMLQAFDYPRLMLNTVMAFTPQSTGDSPARWSMHTMCHWSCSSPAERQGHGSGKRWTQAESSILAVVGSEGMQGRGWQPRQAPVVVSLHRPSPRLCDAHWLRAQLGGRAWEITILVHENSKPRRFH